MAIGGHAEKHHATGNALQHVRPVLCSHDGRRHLHEAPLSCLGARRFRREADHAPIVDGDAIARRQRQFGARAVGRGDALHDLLHAIASLLAGAFRHRTQRTENLHLLRYDVVRRAAFDLGDGQHDRIERVDAACDEALQRHHDRARDRNRIQRMVRGRCVSAPAPNCQIDRVGGGHEGAGARCEHAARHVGRDVNRECAIGPRCAVQQAVVDHLHCAEVPFLAGLKHELDRARETITVRVQQFHRHRQHRSVGIVAARVHAAGFLRGERQARVLRHRQRVHVAAQQHGAALRRTTQRHDQAR